MNIFLPQDLDARAELLNLSTTKHNIMNCQSSKNNISDKILLVSLFLSTGNIMAIGPHMPTQCKLPITPITNPAQISIYTNECNFYPNNR
mgnify:CR=1 FL=1